MTIQEENKILFWQAGSHLWGTNMPESDQDFIGVFVEPSANILGLEEHLPGTLSLSTAPAAENGSTREKAKKGDIETKWYSAQEFVRRVIKGDPNLLPLLWAKNGDRSPDSVFCESALGFYLLGGLKKLISQQVIAHHVMQVVERQKSIEKRMRHDETDVPDWKLAMHMVRVAIQAQELAHQGKIDTPIDTYAFTLRNVRQGHISWATTVEIAKNQVQKAATIDSALPRDEEIDFSMANLLLEYVYTRHWKF